VCDIFLFFNTGVEFQEIPETNGVPLVADMSSNILSRPLDVSKVGKSVILIFNDSKFFSIVGRYVPMPLLNNL